MCLLPLSAALAGCGPGERARVDGSLRPATAATEAASDTALGAPRPMRDFDTLGVTPARMTMVRVAPAREALAVPLPAVESALPEPHASPPAAGELAFDDELRAPIVRAGAPLDRAKARRGWVELDVRVDENGEVSDAMFAEGDADSATVEAAIEAALAMRFYPAVRAGRPVAVWCRQRFDLRR